LKSSGSKNSSNLVFNFGAPKKSSDGGYIAAGGIVSQYVVTKTKSQLQNCRTATEWYTIDKMLRKLFLSIDLQCFLGSGLGPKNYFFPSYHQCFL
jgi:hypothetical protein